MQNISLPRQQTNILHIGPGHYFVEGLFFAQTYFAILIATLIFSHHYQPYLNSRPVRLQEKMTSYKCNYIYFSRIKIHLEVVKASKPLKRTVNSVKVIKVGHQKYKDTFCSESKRRENDEEKEARSQQDTEAI